MTLGSYRVEWQTNTAFTLTQLNQLYLNQVKFQPTKCIRFVELPNQRAPFDHLVGLNWFYLQVWIEPNIPSQTALSIFCSMHKISKIVCSSAAITPSLRYARLSLLISDDRGCLRLEWVRFSERLKSERKHTFSTGHTALSIRYVPCKCIRAWFFIALLRRSSRRAKRWFTQWICDHATILLVAANRVLDDACSWNNE